MAGGEGGRHIENMPSNSPVTNSRVAAAVGQTTADRRRGWTIRKIGRQGEPAPSPAACVRHCPAHEIASSVNPGPPNRSLCKTDARVSAKQIKRIGRYLISHQTIEPEAPAAVPREPRRDWRGDLPKAIQMQAMPMGSEGLSGPRRERREPVQAEVAAVLGQCCGITG